VKWDNSEGLRTEVEVLVLLEEAGGQVEEAEEESC